jgi:hypothetical protein
MLADTRGGAPHMTNEFDNVETTIAGIRDLCCSGADPVVEMPAPQR